MKAEYIPPREDVVMQNEAPDDIYIIVSGEVEIIDCEMEKELVVGTLKSGDMFGEVGALCCREVGELCCRPQSFTYRTKTLSQLLRMNTTALIEAMQTKQEDKAQMLKNFKQVGAHGYYISSFFNDSSFFISKIKQRRNEWSEVCLYIWCISASSKAPGSENWRNIG